MALVSEAERVGRQAQWQKDQRLQLEDEIQLGETETREISVSISHLEAKITEAQQILRESQSTLTDLSVDDFQRQLAYWNTQAAVAQRALEDAQVRQGEHQVALQDTVLALKSMQERKVSFAEELAEIETNMKTLRINESQLVSKVDGR